MHAGCATADDNRLAVYFHACYSGYPDFRVDQLIVQMIAQSDTWVDKQEVMLRDQPDDPIFDAQGIA